MRNCEEFEEENWDNFTNYKSWASFTAHRLKRAVKDKQLILSSLEVNEPAGAEGGGTEEELDFLTEILTIRSQDNITVLLLLCGGGGGGGGMV